MSDDSIAERKWVFFKTGHSTGLAVPMQHMSRLLSECIFLECGYNAGRLDEYKHIEELPEMRILTEDQVKLIQVRTRMVNQATDRIED